MYNKVSKAIPQLSGSEITVCGLFNHAVLGEVHGSVADNDLRRAAPAEVRSCVHTAGQEISIQAISC